MESADSSSTSEIPVWLDGTQRWVTGLTKRTTCDDVIYALLYSNGLHETESTDSYAIFEKWREVERPLSSRTKLVKVWHFWGQEQSNVQLSMRRMDEYFFPGDSSLYSRSRRRHKRSSRLKSRHASHGSHSLRRGCVECTRLKSLEQLVELVVCQERKIKEIQDRIQYTDKVVVTHEARIHQHRVEHNGLDYVQDSYLNSHSSSSSSSIDSSVFTTIDLKKVKAIFPQSSWQDLEDIMRMCDDVEDIEKRTVEEKVKLDRTEAEMERFVESKGSNEALVLKETNDELEGTRVEMVRAVTAHITQEYNEKEIDHKMLVLDQQIHSKQQLMWDLQNQLKEMEEVENQATTMEPDEQANHHDQMHSFHHHHNLSQEHYQHQQQQQQSQQHQQQQTQHYPLPSTNQHQYHLQSQQKYSNQNDYKQDWQQHQHQQQQQKHQNHQHHPDHHHQQQQHISPKHQIQNDHYDTQQQQQHFQPQYHHHHDHLHRQHNYHNPHQQQQQHNYLHESQPLSSPDTSKQPNQYDTLSNGRRDSIPNIDHREAINPKTHTRLHSAHINDHVFTSQKGSPLDPSSAAAKSSNERHWVKNATDARSRSTNRGQRNRSMSPGRSRSEERFSLPPPETTYRSRDSETLNKDDYSGTHGDYINAINPTTDIQTSQHGSNNVKSSFPPHVSNDKIIPNEGNAAMRHRYFTNSNHSTKNGILKHNNVELSASEPSTVAKKEFDSNPKYLITAATAGLIQNENENYGNGQSHHPPPPESRDVPSKQRPPNDNVVRDDQSQAKNVNPVEFNQMLKTTRSEGCIFSLHNGYEQRENVPNQQEEKNRIYLEGLKPQCSKDNSTCDEEGKPIITKQSTKTQNSNNFKQISGENRQDNDGGGGRNANFFDHITNNVHEYQNHKEKDDNDDGITDDENALCYNVKTSKVGVLQNGRRHYFNSENNEVINGFISDRSGSLELQRHSTTVIGSKDNNNDSVKPRGLSDPNKGFPTKVMARFPRNNNNNNNQNQNVIYGSDNKDGTNKSINGYHDHHHQQQQHPYPSSIISSTSSSSSSSITPNVNQTNERTFINPTNDKPSERSDQRNDIPSSSFITTSSVNYTVNNQTIQINGDQSNNRSNSNSQTSHENCLVKPFSNSHSSSPLTNNTSINMPSTTHDYKKRADDEHLTVTHPTNNTENTEDNNNSSNRGALYHILSSKKSKPSKQTSSNTSLVASSRSPIGSLQNIHQNKLPLPASSTSKDPGNGVPYCSSTSSSSTTINAYLSSSDDTGGISYHSKPSTDKNQDKSIPKQNDRKYTNSNGRNSPINTAVIGFQNTSTANQQNRGMKYLYNDSKQSMYNSNYNPNQNSNKHVMVNLINGNNDQTTTATNDQHLPSTSLSKQQQLLNKSPASRRRGVNPNFCDISKTPKSSSFSNNITKNSTPDFDFDRKPENKINSTYTSRDDDDRNQHFPYAVTSGEEFGHRNINFAKLVFSAPNNKRSGKPSSGDRKVDVKPILERRHAEQHLQLASREMQYGGTGSKQEVTSVNGFLVSQTTSNGGKITMSNGGSIGVLGRNKTEDSNDSNSDTGLSSMHSDETANLETLV